jgi:hypothetical protein
MQSVYAARRTSGLSGLENQPLSRIPLRL